MVCFNMKIGVLAVNVPATGNYLNIGKILTTKFDLDLIGNKEQDVKLNGIFSIKNYTKIKGNTLLTWFIRDIVNLWFYCWNNKPDFLFSVQRPDIQGPLVVLFGKLFRIKTIARCD